MPINVSYQPDASLIAGAAYAGGLGQFQAKRFQQQMAVAELADRQQARREQMQYGLASRAQDAAMRNFFGDKNFQQQVAVQNLAGQRAMALQQQANDARALQQEADDERQADIKEQQAELAQRNWMMQHAPGAAFDPAAAVPPMPEALLGRQNSIDMNRQALALPAQYQDKALMTAINRGDPAAIQTGITRGILAYSPDQKTEIRRIQEAMGRLDSDPTMTPLDRARGQRILAERLYSIRPMQVPPDERPQSFDDELKSKIGYWTDVRTGKVYPATFNRNGVPEVIKLPDDEKQGQGAAAKPPPPTTVRETVQTDPKGFIAINKAAEAAVMGRLPLGKESGQPIIPGNYDELVEKEIEKIMARQEKFGAKPRAELQQQPTPVPGQGMPGQSMQPQQGQPPAIPAGPAGEQLPLINNRQELLQSGIGPGQRFAGPDGTIYEVTANGGSRPVGHELQQGQPAAAPEPAPQQQQPMLAQPGTPREAYAALVTAVQGTPRAGRYPQPNMATDRMIEGLLQQPDVRRDLLSAGIILPRSANQPPPPPPPIIQPNAAGAAQLADLLRQHPAGVLIRDARDGQVKLIKGKPNG